MNFSLLISFSFIVLVGCQSLRIGNDHDSAKTQNTKNKIINSEITPISISKKTIYEELTGYKMRAESAPAKILQYARQAKGEKNYALALKRYNTLIKRFPKAEEVRTALYDKSAMYLEMGLTEQSKLNLKMAQRFQVVRHQSKAKKTTLTSSLSRNRDVSSVKKGRSIKKSQNQGNQVVR